MNPNRGYQMSVCIGSYMVYILIYRNENTVAMLARDRWLFIFYFFTVFWIHKFAHWSHTLKEAWRWLWKETECLEALKGTHRGKSGVVEKINRVHVFISFVDGSKERTPPSSLKVIGPVAGRFSSVTEPREKTSGPKPNLVDSRNLDNFRSLSIDLITEMLAQGLSLSKYANKELKSTFKNLEAQVQGIHQTSLEGLWKRGVADWNLNRDPMSRIWWRRLLRTRIRCASFIENVDVLNATTFCLFLVWYWVAYNQNSECVWYGTD